KWGAAMERPAFDRLAEDASGIAQKRLAFAERQVVNPVGVESMVDNQRAERLEIRRTNRRVREGEAAGIDVTALDQQPFRHAEAQLDNRRVRVRGAAIAGGRS